MSIKPLSPLTKVNGEESVLVTELSSQENFILKSDALAKLLDSAENGELDSAENGERDRRKQEEFAKFGKVASFD